MARMWVCGLVLVLVIAQGTPASGRDYELVKEWESALGPVEEGAFYRTTVCPDGAVLLTDSLGRLWALDGTGKELFQKAAPELQRVLASACGADHFYAAAMESHKLLVYERVATPPDLRLAASVSTGNLVAYRLEETGGSIVYALGFRPGVREAIHPVHTTQGLLPAFAEPPQASPGIQCHSPAELGSLVWDKTRKRLIHVPGNPYEFRVYDAAGAALLRRPRNDPGFGPRRVDLARGIVLPSDRVARAARLPDGRFITQVIQQVPFNTPDGFRAEAYLELFDADFQFLAAIPLAGAALGLFQGTSEDGGLYFSRHSAPDGIRLLKATLRVR